MTRQAMRRGCTILDVLAGLAVVSVGVAVLAVAGGAGTRMQPEKKKEATKAPPSDKDNAELLELIRNMSGELAGMKQRIEAMEGQLKAARERLLASNPGMRNAAREAKDASQIRGLIQSLIIFAQNNKDSYPLPSELDKAGMTIAGAVESKNTSSSIISILVYNGFVPLDLCVSPVEVNPNIKVYQSYEFNLPKTAAKPDAALWDPALPVDFTGGHTGSLSYAHLQPSKGRRAEWSNTFNAMSTVLGNRGPEIKGVTYPALVDPKPELVKADSNTLRMYPPDDSWEGNIAYNDGHINRETKMVSANAHEWPTLVRKDGTRVGDCIFFDEPDDKDARNFYLGIFTTSGEKLDEWHAIWD